MHDAIQIRTVNVELLRAGPPHNQLLSPLTQYLGLCGDSGAGIVTLPYEHQTFVRRLRYLRYDEEEVRDRLAVLRDTGVDMAKILGSIPGLPGVLSGDPKQPEVLIHLRLVLSASELALLPFELSKVPVGPTAQSESWLALQTRVPVCITRHIRTVPSNGVRWSTRPRVLFIGGAGDIPFADHRQELLDAIEPFRYPGKDDPAGTGNGRREQYGERLTILEQATFDEVEEECARGEYTHVHVLAHGAEDPMVEGRSFGLALQGEDGEVDVVSGERFASALTSLACGHIYRPDVVTVASCDGGNVGSVETPGASFAHELHQAGIPLVVASQFPLSKPGSISVARRLYRGLLWGKNPWLLLHRLRSELHGRMTKHSHDWASLVVYEALPPDLDEQIEGVRYAQTRRAIDAALEGVDLVVRQQTGAFSTTLESERLDCVARLERAREQLPMDGPFGVECLGLRASSFKRQAQTEYARATSAKDRRQIARHVEESYRLLEKAFLDYRRATRKFMSARGGPVQRTASLHWVMVQMLSLAVILGKDLDSEYWMAAKLSAEMDLHHPDEEERAWAHGSLAELWLLKLAEKGLRPPQRYDYLRQAQRHAAGIVEIFPGRTAFAVSSTQRQFARYADWWGNPSFRDRPKDVEDSPWHAEAGIVDAARQLVETLAQRTWTRAPEVPAAEELAAKELAAKELAAKDNRKLPGTANGDGSAEAPRKPGTAADEDRPIVAAGKNGNVFDIEMLPAGHGDSLWIEYGDRKQPARILIDCGMESTYDLLRSRVLALPPRERAFELFVLTHIDADHIGGAIPFFNDADLGIRFEDVWFNGWKHLPSERLGAVDAEIFSKLIEMRKHPWNRWRDGGPVVVENGDLPVRTLPGGMKLTLLSPTPQKLAKLSAVWKKTLKKHGLDPRSEVDWTRFLKRSTPVSTDVDTLLAGAKFGRDASAPNGSSIGFLAEYAGKSALLLGDAHAPQLVASISKLLAGRGQERLSVDVLKVSHHASRNNINARLLELLDCDRYLISTDGTRFHHPDRETIALLIRHGGPSPTIYFNYKSADNGVWARQDLQEKYDYASRYPKEGRQGIALSL